MKILEELWYGNVNPYHRRIVPSGKAEELIKLIARNEERLLPLLSEEAKKEYHILRINQSELCEINECESFQDGFRTGAKMMQEVMDGVAEEYIMEI